MDFLLRHYSDLNAAPHFLPVAILKPPDNSYIDLKQCDQVKPKTGWCVQARRLPVADLIISRGQGIDRPRGNQPKNHVGAVKLIDSSGQHHGRPDLRNSRARKCGNYDVAWLQASRCSRLSYLDSDASRASARSSSVQVSDQSTLLPSPRSRSRVTHVIT
jgi:hypothetical protein